LVIFQTIATVQVYNIFIWDNPFGWAIAIVERCWLCGAIAIKKSPVSVVGSI
jgi:hypothetical protein